MSETPDQLLQRVYREMKRESETPLERRQREYIEKLRAKSQSKAQPKKIPKQKRFKNKKKRFKRPQTKPNVQSKGGISITAPLSKKSNYVPVNVPPPQITYEVLENEEVADYMSGKIPKLPFAVLKFSDNQFQSIMKWFQDEEAAYQYAGGFTSNVQQQE